MGTPTFYLPTGPDAITTLLNDSRMWNLSIVTKAGTINLIDGDQLLYVAENEPDLVAFLAGCFVATFGGASEKMIQQDFKEGRYSQDRDWDDINAEIEMNRTKRHQ